MRKTSERPPVVFQVGIALLCLLMVSFHLMGGLYARYGTSASSSASAIVAKFEFSDNFAAQTQSLAVSLAPGESETLSLQVENNGECTISYRVIVENLTSNLPIADAEYDVATLKPDESASDNILIEWPAEKSSAAYMGKMDLIRITVIAAQVD